MPRQKDIAYPLSAKMSDTTAQLPFREFSAFLSKYFEGKVQKLSVDAGFSCPNRDGTIGRGGCSYCNNRTFNPDYCAEIRSVAEQLEEGKAFFSGKYPHMHYLAYFQAYTNTYDSLENLQRKYEEALAVDNVVGLVIGTRPDCMPDALLAYLSALHRQAFVLIEYGVETSNDATLQRIHRGHDFHTARETIVRTHDYGVPVGAHLIMGLPGESYRQMVERADVMSSLPLDTLKLHQLQIVRGTRMAQEYQQTSDAFHLFTPDEYATLVVDFLERLSPDIAVERFTSQSPKELLIAPDWGMKNYEFVHLVKQKIKQRNTWQGRLWGGDMCEAVGHSVL